LLGLVSGAVPGPFTALIVAAAIRGGFWEGFWIAVVPLVTETIVLALTAVLLLQLPDTALQWMGIVGGLFVLYLAWQTLRESREPEPSSAEPVPRSPRRGLLQGGLLAILSPTPWVYWFLVGAPLFLGFWRSGWSSGLSFLGAFLGGLIAVHLAIAGAAGYGQRKLPHRWRRRITVVAATALLLVGVGLIWQSAIGNFERIVRGPERLQNAVEELQER
jgi:threonine/homoserine/homoserine lactone efflux protein